MYHRGDGEKSALFRAVSLQSLGDARDVPPGGSAWSPTGRCRSDWKHRDTEFTETTRFVRLCVLCASVFLFLDFLVLSSSAQVSGVLWVLQVVSRAGRRRVYDRGGVVAGSVFPSGRGGQFRSVRKWSWPVRVPATIRPPTLTAMDQPADSSG